MPCPPHLPAVLVSLVSSIEAGPSRRPQRRSVTESSRAGHRRKIPGTTTRLVNRLSFRPRPLETPLPRR